MLVFAQPQCTIAETNADGINRLPLADPLELETMLKIQN